MSTPAAQALSNPLFRGYITAGVVSAVGDQLTLIALPWLALTLSPDMRVVASVLALVALPRAVFLLLGGALADRFDPRRLLVVARVGSAAVLAALCAVLAAGAMSVPLLQAFALLLGTLGALGMPAASSMVPRLLPQAQVQAGNAVTMSLGQVVALVGPVLAGLVLVGARPAAGQPPSPGFLWAFGLDAATFVVSALLLARLPLPPQAGAGSVAAGLRDGWRHLANDRFAATLLGYLLIVNLFVAGPVAVGVPLLVRSFDGSALQYGGFLMLLGVGSLIGMVLSGKVALKGLQLITKMAVLDVFVGLLLAGFVHLPGAWLMNAVLLVVGFVGGYVQASVVLALQTRTPPALMGRVMSFLLFAYVGLVPLSAAVAGVLAQQLGVAAMLECAGIGAALAAVLMFVLTRSRAAQPLAATPHDDTKPEAART